MRKDSILTYVIGYVFGHADLLRELLFAIDRHAKKSKLTYRIIFLGNVLGFDPDLNGTLSLVLNAVERHPGSGLLKGGYDDQILQMIDETDWQKRRLLGRRWLGDVGPSGQTTPIITDEFSRDLEIDAAIDGMDPRQVALLRKGRWFFELDEHIVVHAGLRPGVDVVDQDPREMLSTPPGFTSHRESYGKMVIHGTLNNHVPVEAFPNRIAVSGTTHGTGALGAVCIVPGGEVHSVVARRIGDEISVVGERPSVSTYI